MSDPGGPRRGVEGASDMRSRLVEATYECVARYGIGKTTVEDVAREARVSRATVYRHFPGGKDQLVGAAISLETARFFERLAAAVAGADTLPQLLEDGLLFAHRAVEEHAVLQKILQTEPERLLPRLTVEVDGLLVFVKAFLLPYVERERDRLVPGLDLDRATEHVCRLMVSFISAQGRWDLSDRAQVRQLVRTEVLAGVLRP